MTITDLDTPDRIAHVIFGDELVTLSDAAIHALSINAQLLALGEPARVRHAESTPAAA